MFNNILFNRLNIVLKSHCRSVDNRMTLYIYAQSMSDQNVVKNKIINHVFYKTCLFFCLLFITHCTIVQIQFQFYLTVIRKFIVHKMVCHIHNKSIIGMFWLKCYSVKLFTLGKITETFALVKYNELVYVSCCCCCGFLVY